VIAEVHRLVLRDKIRSGFDVACRELVPVAHQRRQLTDDAIDAREIGRLAFDQQVVALRADADVEGRFEVFEVLVVGAEQCFESPLQGGDAFRSPYLLVTQRVTIIRRSLPRSQVQFLSCLASTGTARRHQIDCVGVFGNAMTSRIDDSPPGS